MTILLNVFESEWLWRLWCVQELVLARRALVHWGSVRVVWEVFSAVAVYVQARQHAQIALLGLGGINNVAMLESFRRQVRDDAGQGLTFSRLLSLTRPHGITEHRDRIFSLLGLDRCLCNNPNSSVAGPETLLVTPDYSQSIEDLYFLIAKRLSIREGSLELLSFVQHEGEVGAGSVPTWVPRWQINKHRLITQFDLVSSHPLESQQGSGSCLVERFKQEAEKATRKDCVPNA